MQYTSWFQLGQWLCYITGLHNMYSSLALYAGSQGTRHLSCFCSSPQATIQQFYQVSGELPNMASWLHLVCESQVVHLVLKGLQPSIDHPGLCFSLSSVPSWLSSPGPKCSHTGWCFIIKTDFRSQGGTVAIAGTCLSCTSVASWLDSFALQRKKAA